MRACFLITARPLNAAIIKHIETKLKNTLGWVNEKNDRIMK